MPSRILAFLLAFFVASVGVSRAERSPKSISDVIERQIQAFQANDIGRAFSFASPSIRKKFGTPERFGQMVRRGYPMVWRPAHWEMLKLVPTTAGPVQVVLFRDADGQLWEAGYLMRRIDGMWRINGVQVQRRPGTGI